MIETVLLLAVSVLWITQRPPHLVSDLFGWNSAYAVVMLGDRRWGWGLLYTAIALACRHSIRRNARLGIVTINHPTLGRLTIDHDRSGM